MKLNKYPEALTYFKRANEVEFDQEVDKEKYRPHLDYGLEECKKTPQLLESESKWSSYHPQPPNQLAPPITPSIRIYDKCNLKSVKDGVLKLRNTKERGWTLKTARDVSIGMDLQICF